eukprot:9482694-Pyramimonas_sp.AAC.1
MQRSLISLLALRTVGPSMCLTRGSSSRARRRSKDWRCSSCGSPGGGLHRPRRGTCPAAAAAPEIAAARTLIGAMPSRSCPRKQAS